MSFVVYVIVQIFAYAVDFSIYATFLFAVGFSPLLSNVISKTAAACFAFFCHRRFTFSESAGDSLARQALVYAALVILNVPMNTALLWCFLLLDAGVIVGKVLADACGLIINYALSKFVAFRKSSPGWTA